ncbi:MAG: RagB/SusD family nutrient uptake outer membrane protein [Tannerella sp.]|jgi:hypothetical protein|nr:RagB/SusD family nutrient uptake outer membrane protein [Tannerella sp.]
MKKNILLIALIIATGCNDDFMERYPETSISPEAFFKTVKDLELYTNTYYSFSTPSHFDYTSDNIMAYAESHSHNDLVRGNITPETATGWDRTTWGNLRKYNILLANCSQTTGEAASINHYVGMTRMMRAAWYYDMVKLYSDVPWYSTPLTDKDDDLLFKTQDPRTVVVDSILADLQFAIDNMSSDIGNRTRFNRFYAAAMMARICLHEGTFRKYHSELNLQSTANSFLQRAVAAAEIVMNSGNYAIDLTGGPDRAYRQLFITYDLSSSKEMILFKDYDRTLRVAHSGYNSGYYTFDWAFAYSRSLMESYSYITPEGKAVPFSTVEGYEKKHFTEVFANRDPRFSQTFRYPEYIAPSNTLPWRPRLQHGGYTNIKWMPETGDEYLLTAQYTDVPVFRFAEVLLIYAEAKAELGTISQNDIDISINKIHERVNLPRTVIGEIVEDATLKAQFPDISDYLLLEIRRERRIELVSEGFRWDDLIRWNAGHLIEKVQEGIYVDGFGVFDMNGDGIPEMGLFESEATNTIPAAERSAYSFYYLKNADGSLTNITLTNGTSGYIVANGELRNRSFIQPKYYYWPIPQTQLVINPNLKQTVYW